jgi:cation:H+ antiporter
LGICGLWLGANWFIKGGYLIAKDFGVAPLIIGLTFGALGTSLPELVVSLFAAAVGKSGISIGNVVGSNMANIGLALGVGAIFYPISVEQAVIKYDYWVALGCGILLYLFTRNLIISNIEGFIFLFFFILYMLFLVARHYFSNFGLDRPIKGNSLIRSVSLFVFGAAGLTIGAKFVVKAAGSIALIFGLTETVIGITAVAIGTSLPELSIVLAGSIKKQPEISLGTIIGSNIINILLIAGLASIICPIRLNAGEIIFQAPAVIVISVLLLPIIMTGKKINRLEGGILLVLYLSYLFFIL